MQADDIRSAVLATIAAVAPETEAQRIFADQPLRAQVELDSMDWLNVAAALQDRLAVPVSESDLGPRATLDSIVDALARRPASSRATADVAAGGIALPETTHVIGGTAVALRPIRPDDAPLEVDFVQRLSSESRYKRFMATVRELPTAKLRYLTQVDQVRHVALVATVRRDGREVLIGVARYVADAAGSGCEFAVAVDDAWQGTGLAGVLMHALIGVASARGLRTMEGSVLAANGPMLKFMRQLGFRLEHDPDDRGTVRALRDL